MTNRGFDAADSEIVLVGGGGAGSSNLSGASGGGGGGGVVFVPKSKGPEIITAPGTYPITIGDGGTAGVWGATLPMVEDTLKYLRLLFHYL